MYIYIFAFFLSLYVVCSYRPSSVSDRPNRLIHCFMSAKAPPKTLHQVRNVAYIFAAWAGLQRGFAEKSANDKLWLEHQRRVRQEKVERQHAAHALEDLNNNGELERAIPAIVPKELQGLVKALKQ
ncbi:protein G4 [Trypanosoma rangeli]|uniref:Protein G4 n=1 Tax=Trypanosoma rangeli TaxID=5698 RepID=A0A422NXB3_TRYRA|nr:protein G4 [Trypanosoma rangeli]RNF10044.1 protein G4 [Trypanosoma rangeli]|eukprot:RNF10044.1 protein G4 [Trypanosoma rangeli]